jgi:hypothetical protein
MSSGPAHGNDPNDPHRVYAVKKEVRDGVTENGKKYAALTIKDATAAPNKQPNLDLLHKSFSKMEQDKYIMMASDAFAFRSARLAGIDTSQSINRNAVGEYKQIAIDVYADKKYAGNVGEAEKEIEKRLANRVAEQKVLNNAGGYKLCGDGTIKKSDDPACAVNGKGTAAADPKQAAQEILRRLNSSTDGMNVAAIAKAIEGRFTKDPKTNQYQQDQTIEGLMGSLKLEQLSGVANRSKLDQLYQQARQNAKPEDISKIGEYQNRLGQNKCLKFTSFCYSSRIGEPLKKEQIAKAGGATGGSASSSDSQIDENEYQPITGDPGPYFKDTREFVFNRFAYAYTQPLADFKKNVTNLDFDKNIDKNIKDVGLYKEFDEMHKKAMAEANQIKNTVDQTFIDRLKSAGATPEQIARVQMNYSKNFDARLKTHMELFGQNKNRDAIMMPWRKNPSPSDDPNQPGYRAPRTPPPNTFQTRAAGPGAPAPRN